MSHRDYYLKGRNDRLLLIYIKFFKDFLREMGADAATIDADVNDMLEFEIELANVCIPCFVFILLHTTQFLYVFMHDLNACVKMSELAIGAAVNQRVKKSLESFEKKDSCAR